MAHTPTTTLLTEERFTALKQGGDPEGHDLLEYVVEVLTAAGNGGVSKTPEIARLFNAFHGAYSWFKDGPVIDGTKLDDITLVDINRVLEQTDEATRTAPADPGTPADYSPAPADDTAPGTPTPTPSPAPDGSDVTNAKLLEAINGIGDRVNAVHKEVFNDDGTSVIEDLSKRVAAIENALPRESDGTFVHFTKWSNHTVNVAGHAVRWTPAVAAFVATLFILLLIKDPTWPATGFMSSLSDWSKMIISGIVSIIAFFLTNRTPSSESAPAA